MEGKCGAGRNAAEWHLVASTWLLIATANVIVSFFYTSKKKEVDFPFLSLQSVLTHAARCLAEINQEIGYSGDVVSIEQSSPLNTFQQRLFPQVGLTVTIFTRFWNLCIKVIITEKGRPAIVAVTIQC